VNEGLAIAFAALHHLVTVNKCRVLFATHFHELADMLGYGSGEGQSGCGPFSRVAFYCSDVDETPDGRITYSYHVQPGINRHSHGLKVAQLAGMPPLAVQTAQQALSFLKQNDNEERSARAQMLQELGKLVLHS
jgi:DNA mismatch repair ATPase MutS